MRYISSGFTHRGGTRNHNEDAYLDVTEQGIWLVADGMGGYQAGDVASQLICDTVDSEIRKRDLGKFTVNDLEKALLLSNKKIRDYGARFLDDQTIGSTVVALMTVANHFHLFWVGDSRCYLARDGQLKQISRDHSQVAEMVEQGLLDEAEAESHPLAHVITRAVGVDDELTPEYLSGEVKEGDIFLICSDGISKEFNQQELNAFLSLGELEEAGMAIMHSALVKKSKDNITCVLVKAQQDCYANFSSENGDDVTIPIYSR
ncbi:PP2C family protein-serine/threonine phosphatase [Gallaecimonas mangrovi]|uniref:PP2C family protein-serine/threonine phosphatase n=1 Tax=Gallaecimonas mangrovi TaxID=2291597 RepID=UPI000E203EA4|nr:protein phosphatase 2C domain-containing protein [Gallaecimonas mangrovi]